MLKLEPLKTSDEFASDPYLKDIVERNLEVAAQACIDIANRIISMEQLEKPRDAYGAIEIFGKVGVLPRKLAERLAPIAGFRNIGVTPRPHAVREAFSGLIPLLDRGRPDPTFQNSGYSPTESFSSGLVSASFSTYYSEVT